MQNIAQVCDVFIKERSSNTQRPIIIIDQIDGKIERLFGKIRDIKLLFISR